MVSWILIGLFIVVGLWLYSIYANVIKNANFVNESLSSIDVQLKKRHDLIPNILTIAKKFMEHEKGLMEDITKLRTQASEAISGSSEKFKLESELNSKFGQLMVQVENYPNLKSDQTMMQSMRTYNEVEEHISAARRFYNSSLTQLRNSVMIFPGNLFAGFASDTAYLDYFHTDESSKQPVNASEYL